MEIPFTIKDKLTNEPITDLVKSDVVLKMSEAPYTEMPYTDLGTIGAEFGEYVLWGVNFYPTSCRLYIKNVVQDDWFGAQVVGNMDLKYALTGDTAATNIRVTGLESATSNLNSALNNKASLTATQLWTGYNVFNTRTSLSGGSTVQTSNRFYGRNDFVTEPPYSAYMPVSNGQVANKYYVDSYVDGKIATIVNGLTGTYQQGINIIRLVPNGTQETGRLYTTWANSMVGACTKNPTITNQITVEIEGNGNSASAIEMASHLPGTTTAFKDYVHFKGYGSNVLVTIGQDVNSYSISASTIGAVVIENLIFQDPLGDNYLTNWRNVIFKNVKFISLYDTNYASWAKHKFYDCELYDCEFIGGDTASWDFNNCKGIIYSEQIPIVQGASLIQYQTPTRKSIGSAILTNENSNLKLINDLVLSSSISASSGGLTIKSPTIFEQVTTVPQLMIGSNNLADDGDGGIEFSGTVNVSSNLIMTGFTQSGPDHQSITITNQNDGYGVASNNRILLEPDSWVQVKVGTTIYAIPLYLPKA